MENVRTEETNISIAPRKAYTTPARMVVLGGIDSVIQTSISAGDDGNGDTTGTAS